MFIIDNFIQDEDLLMRLAHERDEFFHVVYDYQKKGYEATWWKGWWEEKARNIHEELIQYVFWKYDFILKKYQIPIKGFEYWTNLHSSKKYIRMNGIDIKISDGLGWHVNKDEVTFDETDKAETPMFSMIMWPFMQDIDGGFLEITKVKDEDATSSKERNDKLAKFRCRRCDRAYETYPIERIKPKYNRLAIFDGSNMHRVSPVTNGDRWTFAVDAWDKETSMTHKGIY